MSLWSVPGRYCSLAGGGCTYPRETSEAIDLLSSRIDVFALLGSKFGRPMNEADYIRLRPRILPGFAPRQLLSAVPRICFATIVLQRSAAEETSMSPPKSKV